ncbi:MAG TPA: hypothetical protein VGR45_01065 [Stellaceae bacterium]|nr:hypothetical protein [Stellaceae bacterium]
MPHRAVAAMIAAIIALAACDRQMANQDKDQTWHAAQQLPNGLEWPLTPPAGMVPPRPPPKLSLTLLQHSRERYQIDCAPVMRRPAMATA